MVSAPPLSPPPVRRRRITRPDSGQALFRTFANTLALLRILLGGLIAIYLCSGITRIQPNEEALIYRLGKLRDEVNPPGLLFALPAPFDRVVRVPTRTQHEMALSHWSPEESALIYGSTPVSTLPLTVAVANTKGLHPLYEGYTLTGDANIVQARFSARYRIIDPRAYVSAAQPADAIALIDASFYQAATQVLAMMKIDDALGAGLGFFRERVRALVQQRLDARNLGVAVIAFDVAALTPPSATVPAFSDVTSAQVEARTMVENSRTYRAQILPQGQSDAYRVRQQADAAAHQLVLRANAEAASFAKLAAEYRRAPDLIRIRLRAEAIEEVLPRVKTRTVLPADTGQINLFLRDTP